MEAINRATAKEIVTEALLKVGSIGGDIEGYTFAHFHDFHKSVFLRSLKIQINILECHNDLGDLADYEYFDLDLHDGITDNWPTMRECIDYITENYYRIASNTNPIIFS